MKKLLVTICVALPVTLLGQVLIGPSVGGQFNWVSFDDSGYKNQYPTTVTMGYQAGASVSFRMVKQVFLQATVQYSQRKKKYSSEDDPMFSNEVRYNYIDMPILFTKEFKMSVGKNKHYNIYGGIGPLLSYWLGGKGRITSSELNENGVNPPNYDLNYKIVFGKPQEDVAQDELNVRNANRLQLGLIFSGGLVFEPANFNKFIITIDYRLGHSFFAKDTDAQFGLPGTLFYEEEMQSRFQGIGCSLHYFIDLKTEDRKKGKSTSKIRKAKN